MEYLRNSNNTRLPQDTQLFEGSSEQDLLSVRFLGFGVKTTGKDTNEGSIPRDDSLTDLSILC